MALGRAIAATALTLVLGNRGSPTHDTATFTLIGQPVTISFVDQAAIGHGEFRLDNRGRAAVVVALDGAWFETSAAASRALSPLSAFDDDHKRALDPSRIEIPPGATLNVSIGFPRIAYSPRHGEECAIGLRVSAGATIREARSPLQLVRRHPLD